MDNSSVMWRAHLRKISSLGVQARKKERLERERKERELLFSNMKKVESKLLLSRLCGFLAGDGSVPVVRGMVGNTIHYDIKFYPDDIELAKIFVDTFQKIYNKRPKIKNMGNYFKVEVCSKVSVVHLNEISAFGSMVWRIPEISLISDDSKIEFVRDFYDCEAYVGKRRIDIQSVNENGLKKIKSLLQEFGINSRFYTYERKNPKWNTNYILVICGKENIIRYAKLIGFNHSAKKEKLNQIAGMAELVDAPDSSF